MGGLYLVYRDKAEGPAARRFKENGPIYFAGRDDAHLLPGSCSLYAIAQDGSGFRQIQLSAGSALSNDIAVSPDGRFLASSNWVRISPRHIFVLRTDGSDVRQITEGPGSGHSFPQEAHPAWSPDGKRIAFVSTRCCDTENSLGRYALYVVDADGSGLLQLTDGSQNVFDPAWSPDGSTIAFASQTDGGPLQIWLVDPDGSHPRLLTDDGRVNDVPAWSPDGEHLAYLSRGNRDWQIRIIRRNGTDDRSVYSCKDPCRFGGHSVDWSPDGASIAFTFGRGLGKNPVWRIGLVSPDGTGFRALETPGIQVTGLSWAASL